MNNTEIDRRGLLKAGGLAIAGAIFAGEAHAQAPAQNSSGMKDEKPLLPKTVEIPAELQTPSVATFADEEPPGAIPFPRPNDEAQAWKSTVRKLATECPITTNESLSGPLNRFLLRIESGFTFKRNPTDTDFSPLHIEPLLDQAADLLDRGLRDRAVWDDQSVKALELWLELHEYKELDTIHSEEERSGVYEVPWKISNGELRAETVRGVRQNSSC
ncbi:MAG: hypothetical protein L0Z50_22545 [Verrucomicrobiales bacterium]|nr:hypothetical protein [Verrucomicrobiales bacterium]